jgi:hypothetical protein
MKYGPQVLEEAISGDYNWRWDFSFRDIPAGIANNTAQVFPLSGIVPAGVLQNPQMRAGDTIIQAHLHLVTPFANSADAAFNSTTMSVGDQASATRFFSAVQGNLNGAFVPDSFFNPGSAFIYLVGALPQFLQFTLNSMAAKSISNLTQGKLWVDFELFRGGAKERNLDLSQPSFN